MEYAQITQSSQAPRPMPELGRLKAAAQRIGKCQAEIGNFVDRFHGSNPGTGSESASASDSYQNDLNSLFVQIERLESTVAALDSIG